MKPARPPGAQAGVALVTVMLIMALLATLATYLVEDGYLAIRRVSNQQDAEQGYHAAVYAEQWARKILEADALDNNTDHPGEAWASQAPALPADDPAVLQTAVADLQGRFNLNNLQAGRDAVWYPAFRRLLAALELDPELADAVVDWIDRDINVGGHHGAEDPEYLLRDPPYRAANQPMAGIGELAWVQGMTAAAIERLAPHVAALPAADARINVNTATTEVLQVLSADILTAGRASALAAGRGPDGYPDTQTVLARPELAGQAETAEPLISVRSEYFGVRARVRHGRYDTVLYSLIARPADTRQASVIRRRRGVS